MGTTPRVIVLVRLAVAFGVLGSFCTSGCSGSDHLTEPVVHVGGTSATTLVGTSTSAGTTFASSNENTTGGRAPIATGTATVDWANDAYRPDGGTSIGYQNHYNGTACFASCHAHRFTVAGTIYTADRITTAGNVEIGIFSATAVVSTYSGSKGNFYMSTPSPIDWATAVIAVRTATGSYAMRQNAKASGDCNSCHDGSNRIIAAP